MSRGIKVLKFGGSSLGNAERIRAVTTIIVDSADDYLPIVVVSAIEGVTNQLELIAKAAGCHQE